MMLKIKLCLKLDVADNLHKHKILVAECVRERIYDVIGIRSYAYIAVLVMNMFVAPITVSVISKPQLLL